ncbi:MAG: hypothetical protein K2Q20_10185 [Phycisphaerales bacterium]|nr:hypothetical protein [Phycisphaerales bacterium]
MSTRKKDRRSARAKLAKTAADVVPLAWIRRTKYRALAMVVAIVLATVATITFAGLPWVPVVGVAVAAACVSMATLTTRLLKPTCLDCGRDLSKQPVGVQGIICPDCGAVNTPGLVQLAQMGDPQGREPADGDGSKG